MFTSLIQLFYPDVCAGCDSVLLPSEKVVCTQCRHKLPLTCHHLNQRNEAREKFDGKLNVEFAGAHCYFHKMGIAQHLIHKLKYKGRQEIGRTLGKWYTERLMLAPELATVDFVIPVPIHAKRLKKRGYNQVDTFAEAIARRLCVPVESNLLYRTVFAQTQTKKDKAARANNTDSVFDINEKSGFDGSHFLIVDDVLTTGATLVACGKALQKIPDVRVSVACLAFTVS
jgi:ComF family protein